MIKSFSCKETEKVWHGQPSRKLPPDIQNIARRKLRMINNALNLNDLKTPPGNRLKLLQGIRKKEYSIRINDQWRICFTWENGDSWHLNIEDYH